LQPDQISPELVLVDPDLARLLRGPPQRPQWFEVCRSPSTPRSLAPKVDVERDSRSLPSESRFGGITVSASARAVIAVGLGLVAAFAVTAETDQRPERAPRVAAALRPPTAKPTYGIADASSIQMTFPAKKPVIDVSNPVTEARLERQILVSLPRAARDGRAPRAFVDPVTSLVSNRTHVTCKQRDATRTYACATISGTTTLLVLARIRASGGIELVWPTGRP
jgi:hypothetical protein